ncbi:MAG: hypothetical protein V3S03_08370 [Vicinamibacteria bacterium]
MTARKKSPKTPEPASSSSSDYRPAHGEIVEIEILEGHRVREPFSKRVLETGDRVTFSTYFARRLRDGGVRFRGVAGSEDQEA